MSNGYRRIRYPNVGENAESFENYKVFPNHWSDLAHRLRRYFEIVRARGESKILLLYGGQGIGKTIFANRLERDLEASAADLGRSAGIAPNRNNLWHLISGDRQLSADLIKSATEVSVVKKVENSVSWVKDVEAYLAPQKNRVAIVIADNAEGSYFRQGLVDLSVVDYMQLQDNPNFLQLVAQKLVSACRNKIKSSLIVMLTNDKNYAENLQLAVDGQHKGLMETLAFPEPSPKDKEDIVRVNVNRLNEVSYWYCIDRAGPSEKGAVYTSISGAAGFRDAFEAIDNALNSENRAGRPANKNIVSLIAFHADDVCPQEISQYASLERTEFNHKWISSFLFNSGWAEKSLQNPRDCKLLESEWKLRIITMGNPFLQGLLKNDPISRNNCFHVLEKLKIIHGVGTTDKTRISHAKQIQSLVDKWSAKNDFDAIPF